MKTCFSEGKLTIWKSLLSKRTPPLLTPLFFQILKTRTPPPDFRGGGEETMCLYMHYFRMTKQ